MSDQQALDRLRARIDAIDEQVQDLLNERAACAKEVAEVKQQEGGAANFYRPEREAQVLRTVSERNRGPLPDEEITRLFREIMSACLALEKRLQIGFLGPEGTFTQAAALKHFGHSVETIPLAAIDEVFREVEAGAVDFGLVPVENSTEGVVNHTLDMFLRSPLKICGEVELRIHHHLLSKGHDLLSVRRVYSHQQSLAQCREWLDANLSQAERIAVLSNAEAARRVMEQPDAAAIAGETAAELYGLNRIASNIEDNPDNTTRFLVIGKQRVPPSGRDKTSLLISTRNQPGALHRLLEPIARNGLSMTRIESRPSRLSAWDYVFFVDLEGHAEESQVAKALEELQAEAAMFKWLGSYPAAVL
jgi:chorismate mutase/prephenate dehydratase